MQENNNIQKENSIDKPFMPEIRFKEFTNTWEQRKLGDLGTFKNGMNFSKDAMGKGFPFVNLQNIFGKNVIDIENLGLAEATDNQLKEYSLKEGDVLFVRSSVKLEGVGEAAVVPEDLENTTYSGFIIRFRDEVDMDKDFKRFVFGTNPIRNQIMAKATNSANKNISQDVLNNLEICLPLKEEQHKIGTFFAQLDNTITLHQCECDKLKQIKKSMLQKMFPKDGSFFPEIRFKGFTAPWEQRKLGDYLDYYTNKDNSKQYPPVAVGRYGIRKRDEIYSKDLSSDISKNRVIDKETMIIGMGSIQIDFGFLLTDEKYSVSPAYATYHIKNVYPKFLEYLLNRHNYELSKAYMITGARQGKSVDKDGLLAHLLYVPCSIKEQEKICTCLNELDNLITLHQKECDKLKQIKKAMLQKMFI